MNKETKQLIIAVALAYVVVLSITLGVYFNSEPVQTNPCENVSGCDYYQCEADHESRINAINMYLLKKQNCLLERIENETKTQI
jgi:hypothetical protein